MDVSACVCLLPSLHVHRWVFALLLFCAWVIILFIPRRNVCAHGKYHVQGHTCCRAIFVCPRSHRLFFKLFFLSVWFHLNETHTITPAETLKHRPVLTVQLVYTVYDSQRWSFPHGCNLVYSATPLFACTPPLYNYTMFNIIQLSCIIWMVFKLGLLYYTMCIQIATMWLWCILNVLYIQDGHRILSVIQSSKYSAFSPSMV